MNHPNRPTLEAAESGGTTSVASRRLLSSGWLAAVLVIGDGQTREAGGLLA